MRLDSTETTATPLVTWMYHYYNSLRIQRAIIGKSLFSQLLTTESMRAVRTVNSYLILPCFIIPT